MPPKKKLTLGSKRVKSIKGYGVFCRAYGGLIGFSTTEEVAYKIKMTEFSDVSMSRSEDEFKIKPVTIRYLIPCKKKK